MTSLHVHAIDPSRLDTIRAAAQDEHGNAFEPYRAHGWEPLRCCLRLAAVDESIALISYSPFPARTPWAEWGPVYIHATACAGYPPDAGLPEDFRRGPRILRSYRADGSLDYDHVTLVPEGEDLQGPLEELLTEPAVETVHVRALLTQCFTYAVSDGSRPRVTDPSPE